MLSTEVSICPMALKRKRVTSSNVCNHVRDEFRDEDIIVCAVADAATQNADGQREGGDCGDQVVGADDRGDNGC